MPRQKQFNADTVLDRAMELFWYQGFEATSMQALVTTMEINRFSLYDTFGGKHDLFMAACRRYRTIIREQVLAPLYAENAAWPEVVEFLERIAAFVAGDRFGHGCLLNNAAAELANRNESIRSLVCAFQTEKERLLADALKRAQENGDITNRTGAPALARLVVAGLNGVILSNKAHRDPERLQHNLDSLVCLLRPDQQPAEDVKSLS